MKPFVPLDERYSWSLRAARQGAALVRRHNIDLIWATSPVMSNLYAAYLISRETGTPYLIDFRDVAPTEAEQASFAKRRTAQLENAIISKAAAVSYVAPQQEKALLEKYPQMEKKPRCLIYNWFDESKTRQLPEIKQSHFSIVHGGALYMGTRRLDHFFEALAYIKRDARKEFEEIIFYQYGYEKGFKFLGDIKSRYALGEAVRLCEKISQEKFLSICKGADILLLVVGHDTTTRQHAGAIPGKLYDYFSACRPILVIGPVDCEAAKMVTSLNRGIAVADDNAEHIAEAVMSLARGEGKRGKLDLSLEAVREFESEEALRKIAQIFHVAVRQD